MVPVHVAAQSYDLHLPACRSLKQKRGVVKPLVEHVRRTYHVAVAETDHHDQWQRVGLGVAVVAATEGHACDILDAVDRYIWSQPEVEVVGHERSWLETDG